MGLFDSLIKAKKNNKKIPKKLNKNLIKTDWNARRELNLS